MPCELAYSSNASSSGSPAPVPTSASLANTIASRARCGSGGSTRWTVIRFSVKVSVLSVAIIVTEPSASTALSRRTTAFRLDMRSTPRQA